MDGPEGTKREADVDTAALRLREDALAQGVAMEDTEGAACAAVPGAMTQPNPMDQSGAPFMLEEAEERTNSGARAKEAEAGATPGERECPDRYPRLGGHEGEHM